MNNIREEMAVLDDYPVSISSKDGTSVTFIVDMPVYDSYLVYDLMHDVEFGKGYVHLDGKMYRVFNIEAPDYFQPLWLIEAEEISYEL